MPVCSVSMKKKDTNGSKNKWKKRRTKKWKTNTLK
jgi:hypothetical protein